MKIASERNRNKVTDREELDQGQNKLSGKSKLLRVAIGKKRVKKVPSDAAIKHNGRYGRLTVNKTAMKSSEGRRYYKSVCDCGEVTYLASYELLTRKRLDSGCMGFYCNQSPPERLVWHNPEYSLAAQISQALAKFPQEVANEWGGRAYEGVLVEGYEAGSNKFIEDVWDMVDFESRCWWVTRKNSALPFTVDNVTMAPVPDKTIFSSKQLLVRYGDAVMTVDQAAAMFDVDVDKAFELRAQCGYGEDFMNALIEESLK